MHHGERVQMESLQKLTYVHTWLLEEYDVKQTSWPLQILLEAEKYIFSNFSEIQVLKK